MVAPKLTFKPQEFQLPFFRSVYPFPCRVGPWADGKTVCMIMKGMMFSMLYPGNEGLFIRSRFNALQRSTMRDFTAWTGLKVSVDKKMVEVPGTGSFVHFLHTENMEEFRFAIQGMNLGWVGIEQGDELESPDVFEMLMGRVRRVLTPNSQVQEALVRMGEIEEPVEDWKTIAKEKREELEKCIVEELGYPTRQIMVIANACGHNWIWKRWHPDSKEHLGIEDGYDYSEGKPFENKEFIPDITLRNWETLKRTSPKKYNRYVLNSHEDYDIEGAYYAALMSDALKEKRCERDDLYDGTQKVWTFWDLGVSDDTVIWFVQFTRDSVHLVDYYAATNAGMEHYANVLSRKTEERGYIYGEHFLPHDARQRLQGRQITTRAEILRNLRKGEEIRIVERHLIEDRIQASRSLIPKCKFAEACAEGVECLNRYHREVNKMKSTDEAAVFLDKPAHDRYSHGADGFGYLAISYRYAAIDGKVLGYREPVNTDPREEAEESEEYERKSLAGLGLK